MINVYKKWLAGLWLGCLVMATCSDLDAQSQNRSDKQTLNLSAEKAQPSIGPDHLRQSKAEGIPVLPRASKSISPPFDRIMAIGTSFLGFNFADNSTETGGSVFIPPDPIGAAGLDRLIAVVNVMIEARDKSGTLLWRDALKDFFAPLLPTTFTFDPKVVYDHYEDRFVVITLERVEAGSNPDPGNISRILIAVSKTATPASASNSDWYYQAIDAKESIGGYDHWVDYPGFELDEEAVYVTGNMFVHSGGVETYGVRLWIVDKGLSSGFYNGGTSSVNRHDPYPVTGDGIATTTMPALVYGSSGAGPVTGTYLVSYSGLNDVTNEYAQVVRVNNPLGSVSFTQQFIFLGNIDVNGSGLPDAPQSDSDFLIEVNDRRALDAVWRNNRLWLTTTINPISGPDAGETTAYWIRLDTTNPSSISLDDQGNIGGQDIDPGYDVYTFFPSLAVNDAGDAYFGFSASNANIYPGAYCAGRKASDPSGTVRATETIRAGEDYYERTFGGTHNRWGDYSGASLDPTDDNLFWIFNEYAMTRGTITSPPVEDGRWATAWAAVSFVQTVFTNGADGTLNFNQDSPSPPEVNWPFGQFSLNGSSSGAVLNDLTITLSGSYTNLDGSLPFRLFATNTNNFSAATAIGSDAATSGGSVTFNGLSDALPSGDRYYWITVDLAAGASGSINGSLSAPSALDLSGASLSTSSVYGTLSSGSDVSLPVQLSAFSAEAEEGQIVLYWTTQSETANLGFIIQRGTDFEGRPYADLASYAVNEGLRGQGNTAEATAYQFSDYSVESNHTYYYILIDVDFSGRQTAHGPLEVTASSTELTASDFHLDQNFPNPFNPRTLIKYHLESTSEIDLSIFNTLGQKVVTLVSGKQPAGSHSVEWDATSFTNGVYLYRITTNNGFSETKKLIVLK